MDLYIFQKINPVKDFFSFVNLLDMRIFNGVNQLTLKWLWLDTLVIFFAEYLEYVLVFCLFLFLLKNRKKYLSMILKAFSAAILARLVIVNAIRWLWEKPRPFALLNFAKQNLGGFIENQVNLLITHSATPSFPSGHAAFYFAIATVVYLYNKKAGISFFIASFLISFARVLAGIHWPSDIIAGALIGIFSGWLINKISKKF